MSRIAVTGRPPAGRAPGPAARSASSPPADDGRLRFSTDPFRLAIFALTVMTISRIHQHFHQLNPLRPALTMTALAAIYAYMNPRYLVSGSILRTWPAKATAGMLLAACLSVPFGISVGGSGAFILFEFSKTIIFALLLTAAIRNVNDLFTMVWAFVVSCGALSYLSLFVFRMRKASDDGLLRIQNAYSYDSNDLACVAVVGLAITLLALSSSRQKGKIASFIVILGLGATVAKTGSRGGFVGLVACGLALLVMLNTVPLAKRIGFVLATGLALALAAPPGYWEQMGTILNPKQDYNWTSPTGRKEVFKRGIGYMMRNPVTGIGIDNFPRAEGTISDRAQARNDDPSLPGIKWSVAHNSFLEAAAEMGLVGLFFFCMLVFGGIFGIARMRRRIPKAWVSGTEQERFLYYASLYLPVAFTAFAAAGAFVSFAYRDLVYALGALSSGLIVCVEQRLKAPASPAQPTASARVLRRPRPAGQAPSAAGAVLLPPPSMPESRHTGD